MWGESVAARYLREKHYKVLAANYRTRFGEIDIIAYTRKYLVFVEVKLRKSDAFAQAMDFVDVRKQERIRLTADMFITQYGMKRRQPRFDVIEIYAPDGYLTENPRINHMEGAF